jgi:surface antigen
MVVRIVLLALLLLGLSARATASNLQFLRDAPISKMTKEDSALFQAAMREALEHDADGVTRRWENPKTGASGTLTPVSTSMHDGVKCRKIEIINNVQGQSGRSAFDMCRQPNGEWVSTKRQAK